MAEDHEAFNAATDQYLFKGMLSNKHHIKDPGYVNFSGVTNDMKARFERQVQAYEGPTGKEVPPYLIVRRIQNQGNPVLLDMYWDDLTNDEKSTLGSNRKFISFLLSNLFFQ